MATIQELEANRWLRLYAAPGYKNPLNTIRVSAANTRRHNLRVCQVCLTLLENHIPFYTEVRLKNGARPDIVCPTHVFKIIEILQTETEEDFNVKKRSKYGREFDQDILLHDANKVYQPGSVL